MKRWALLCGAMLLCSGIAAAQENPRLEVFGGYSYVHVSISGASPSVTANLNGGSASGSFNLNNWLGVVADFGGYHSSSGVVNGNVYSYMFGPKISMRRGRITPFAHALFGGAHATSGGGAASQNAFATALGGGLDWNATEHLGVRVVQAEYFLTKFNDTLNNRQNNVRVSGGVVFRF